MYAEIQNIFGTVLMTKSKKSIAEKLEKTEKTIKKPYLRYSAPRF